MKFLIPHEIDTVAEEAPDRLAMRFVDDNMNYADLVQRSNALAHTLRDHGVVESQRVGIYMEKSLYSAVALYGIMKAGAAYVPLDPTAPVDRIEQIVRDCDIRHLISAPGKRRALRALATRHTDIQCVVGISGDEQLPWRQVSWEEVVDYEQGRAPLIRTIESDLAYIIYTSGSTGRPKGIMHTHASGLSFSRWAAHEYGLRSDDVLSNHAPLHFDLSILDYFAGAVAGCTTSVIPEAYTKLPASYSQLIEDHRITVLYTVPYAMVQLLKRGMLEQRNFDALRWAIFGGEPFPMKHLRALMDLLPHVKFDNIYGPAEVNGITHYTVPPLNGAEQSIPIGPIASTAQGLIVDHDGMRVAPGEVGELLVRTPTMMQGYWNQPALNERCFYRTQELPEFDVVYFRTGDLVEDRGDGVLWFHGRKDRQVKVRGYRIELDEVEAALSEIEAVDECAAFVLAVDESSEEIFAAVVLKASTQVDPNDLIAALRRRLPAYAIPSEVRIQSTFPRTPTGKVDRRALAASVSNEIAGANSETKRSLGDMTA